MKFMICLFYVFAVLFADVASAATLSAENGAQYGLNLASPNMMAKHQLGTIVIKNQVRTLKAVYDFSVLGGAVGTVNLRGANGRPVIIPNKAVVVDCLIDVATPGATSASGTIALSTGQTAADLKAATAAASYTGLVACIPVGTAATAIKMSGDRTVAATIATGAITAGKFNVLIQYIISE